jgi:transposase, IS30 family
VKALRPGTEQIGGISPKAAMGHHGELARRLGFKTYFADPYSSWQRGTNENTNGLIRQYFPKKHDFGSTSHQRVARIARKLNNRPRKCLAYRTPAEVLAPALRFNL